MNKIILIISLAAIALWMSGCAFMTRTDRDLYTITERDTTDLHFIQNAPGNKDNGVVFPSTRTFVSERNVVQRDSTVVRHYPDFIRMGVFESVGMFAAGDRDYNLSTGLFGIYPDEPSDNNIFVGGLWRFGIGEWRLRWFRDAPNWTIGTSIYEHIAPDRRYSRALASVFPLYIRHRIYFREDIPYICLTPAFGIGYYPSQYINLSVSLDVGSIGGLNMRAYAGYAIGQNTPGSPHLVESHINSTVASKFPYMGIGISVLDFHNLVEETYREWKDHEHSAWNIGLVQAALLGGGGHNSVFSTQNESAAFNGFMVKLANASVAIPIESLDNKLYAGTSLLNIFALGKNSFGAGILPIRVGYWQTVLADELSAEPFIEYNYFPSKFINLGGRLNFRLNDMFNLSFMAGYASGNGNIIDNDILDFLEISDEFSGAYVGVGLNILDRIFFPEELRYNK
ncbi:MAG: hypothetical protein ACLFQX_05125 [Candidatus Kapaibacterium sp.]